MNSLAFMTHPSVRVIGTENNYTPVQCFDPACPNRTPHMHCPFCVKTESYQDPVILKAHYRVKHVDKGIEFAGLKILRCCDHCDIVGVIKGEKKFKRAHWHCYRCRNGFNRRDEAIKHYKTHFRNPQTTFQIQISQEVNSTVNYSSESQTAATNIYSDQESVHSVLTQTAADAASTPNSHLVPASLAAKQEGAVQVSIGAHETIEAEGQTIMIIQSSDAHLDNSFPEQIVHTEGAALPPDKEESETSEEGECYRLIIEEIPSNIIHTDLTCLNCGNNMQDVSSLDGKNGTLEKKYESAEIRCQRLEEENMQLKSQIEQLKAMYENAVKEVEQCRERDRILHQQFVCEAEKSLPDLRQAAISQFTDLLDQQLSSLRQTYLSQVAATVVRLQLPVASSENEESTQVDYATLSAKMLEGYTAEKAQDQQADRSLPENGTGGIAMSLEPALVMCVNNPLAEDAQDDELDQASVTVHELQVDSGDVHELHVELAQQEPKEEEEEAEIQLEDEREQTGGESEYEPAEKRRKEA